MSGSDTGIRLGSLAVRYGMITVADLHRALSMQARDAAEGRLPRRLGLILLAERLLSESDLEILLRQQETFESPIH